MDKSQRNRRRLGVFSMRAGSIALGLSFVLCHGPSAQAVSLEDAVRMGLSNPEIREAAANRRALDHELRQARALYYPTVDLRGATGAEHADTPSTRARINGDDWLWRSEASLTLRQTLFDGNSTNNLVDRQAARVKAAAARVVERSEFIGLDIVQAYLEVLRQGELLRIAGENATTHQSSLGNVLRRVQGGRSGIADQRQAESRLSQARADQIDAQRRYDDARATYIRLVGAEPADLSVPVLAENLVPTSSEQAVLNGLAGNPSIGAASLDVAAARADIEASRANYWPRLDFEATGSRGNNIGGLEGRNDDITLMLVARWNLYNGGGDTARHRATIERANEARERMSRLELTASEEARKSFNAMVRQREQAATLRERLASTQRVFDAYGQQFNVGQRDLLDLLDAQNDVFLARNALLTAEYSALFAGYRTLAVSGELLAALHLEAPSEASGGRVRRDPGAAKQ